MITRVTSFVLATWLGLACTAAEPASNDPPRDTKASRKGEAEQPDATIVMTAEGCKLGDEPFAACAALCKRVEAGELAGADFVELFSAEAKPDDLSLVIGCLTSQGVTKIATRAF
jgi:hypothetical protein